MNFHEYIHTKINHIGQAVEIDEQKSIYINVDMHTFDTLIYDSLNKNIKIKETRIRF